MLVDFELKGEMPLLMHADDVEQADQLDEWRKAAKNNKTSKAGDDRSPAWSWQTYLYSDGEHVAMPQVNPMVALRQAGAQKILKKQKTFKEITQSGLLITTEFVDFFAGKKQIPMASMMGMRDQPFRDQAEAVKKFGFSLYVKRARVGQSKHIRVRPRFDDWSVRGQIQIIATDVIDLPILQELFDLAGRVGLCDWRPGCKTPGPWGIFSAKLSKAK